MIYICTAPCKACDACCKACGDLCAPCSEIIDRPLGGYVLLTFIGNFVAAALAVVAVADKDVRACKDAPITAFCAAAVCIAILHVGFSIYLQSKLIKGLSKAGCFPGQDGGAPGAAAVAGGANSK